VIFEVLYMLRAYDMTTFRAFPQLNEYWSHLCNIDRMAGYIAKEKNTPIVFGFYSPFVRDLEA
jgi:hypothetical protein